MGISDAAKFTIKNPETLLRMNVKKSVKVNDVREVCVCAVLRGVSFTQENYDSFIDLQDKLHHNLGRKRTLVSIGTHDLDTVSGPFTYEALPPQDIKFIALGQEKETDANELFEILGKHIQLKPFLKILEGKTTYPIIKDSNGVVLSLPPIINGEHSKITLNTKNVLIEITATDYTKAYMGLINVVTAFSLYCQNKFEVEQVEVVYEEGKTDITPQLETRNIKVDTKYLNTTAGINISREEIVKNLDKMGFVEVGGSGDEIELTIPVFRADILHPCDIAEELAIAYGFDKIVPEMPPVVTIGKQFYLSKMTELLRHEMAAAGYKECLNFALCSLQDNTTNLNLPEDLPMVTIGNAKTVDFQAGRTNLISGLLKTLHANKKNKLPIELFEVTDVILRDDNEVGAKNERRIAAIRTNQKTSELSEIHGTLDLIMAKLGVKVDEKTGYCIKKGTSPTYFKDLQADIYYKGELIGHMGILEPSILYRMQWPYPISAIEFTVEGIIRDFYNLN